MRHGVSVPIRQYTEILAGVKARRASIYVLGPASGRRIVSSERGARRA